MRKLSHKQKCLSPAGVAQINSDTMTTHSLPPRPFLPISRSTQERHNQLIEKNFSSP